MKSKLNKGLSRISYIMFPVIIPTAVISAVTWYAFMYEHWILWYTLPISSAVWSIVECFYRKKIKKEVVKECVVLPHIIVIQLIPLVNWWFFIAMLLMPIEDKIFQYLEKKREAVKNDIRCPKCKHAISASEYMTPSGSTSNECPYCREWYITVRVDGRTNYSKKEGV